MSKQHCRLLQVERFFRQSRNERIEHVQFVSTLSKGRNNEAMFDFREHDISENGPKKYSWQ